MIDLRFVLIPDEANPGQDLRVLQWRKQKRFYRATEIAPQWTEWVNVPYANPLAVAEELEEGGQKSNFEKAIDKEIEDINPIENKHIPQSYKDDLTPHDISIALSLLDLPDSEWGADDATAARSILRRMVLAEERDGRITSSDVTIAKEPEKTCSIDFGAYTIEDRGDDVYCWISRSGGGEQRRIDKLGLNHILKNMYEQHS